MRTQLKSLMLPMLAALALAAAPRLADAQKALVYCPVSVDASGCTVAKAALTTSFPGGVDTGFDGSAGTVDLKTVDLFQYSVVVVPSLAETDSTAPYALLRDSAVAGRLKLALLGRRAFWSGTPDQGVLSTTRPLKDALIRNLAAWASASFATVNAPGLVVLQDNSDVVTSRYSWVQPITGLNIVADSKLASYSSVQSLSGAGNAVLTSDGSTLAYANMASYGFQAPAGGAGLSLDAVGQTGTSVGGQVVLITQGGANTGGAVVQTDKDDYAPGTPVIITGTGFGANETVLLLLHEDPTVEPDFTRTATTDANGGFVYSSFKPDTLDVDVRFVLTATGQSSGKVAQTTFTDAQPTAVAIAAPTTVTVAPGAAATYAVNVTMGGNSNTCTVTLSVSSVLPTGVTAAFSGGANPFDATASFTRTLTLTTVNSGSPANRVTPGTYPFTVTAARSSNCQGNGILTASGTLVVSGPVPTTLVQAAPAPATVSFGSAGPVTLSATLTRTTGGAAVSGATITFTVDGSAAGSAVTNASGVAALTTYNPSALSAAAHTVVASSAQQTVAGTTYDLSTSANQTLTVAKANQTIAFGAITTKTFGDPDFLLSATASSGLPVSYAATGNCTVTTSTVSITGAGSCTITASQAGSTNYEAAVSVQQSFTINKGAATLTIDPASLTATYDGIAHAATVTTTPAGLTVVAVTYAGVATAPTNAGSYAVVAKLTNANYTATDATGTLNIARATPSFSNISIAPITYQAPTATISGTVKSGSLAATGSVGITVSGTGGTITGAATVDASGNFTTTVNTATLPAKPAGYDVALLLPQSANFEQASDGTQKLVVNKGTQSITFGALTGKTFGDAAFAVSASSSSGLGISFSASGSCSVAGTTVTITGAGNCTVTADQVGDDNFQAATSVPQSFTVAKATATVNVSGFSGTYDGAAHGATGTATGVGGADLIASLNFGQSFTNVPGGAATWTFTGGANYLDATGSVPITINRATGSISINGPSTITYGQSGSLTTNKVGDGAVSYAATGGGGSVCSVDAATGAVSMLSGTGDCKITATLAQGANYTGAASSEITIAAAKAAATISVNGFSGVYDGQPHGATGTATGINSANLNALLNLGASFTNVPGGAADWSFAGDANYQSASGSVQITITKANQTTAVALSAPSSMTYGQAAVPLTATGGDGTGAFQFSVGTSTGCSLAGPDLSVVNASGTCTVTALRLGDNNHFDSPATAPSTVTLIKANATVSVTGYSGIYDGLAHGATGSAKGVLNEDLAAQLTLGATFTNFPGGTANWSFAGGNNYNSTSGTAAIDIAKRSASVTPQAASKIYGQSDPSFTGSLSNFVAGDNVTATYSRTAGENVAGNPYTISATLAPIAALGNYAVTYGTAVFTINPATPTVSVTGGAYPYDGANHPATGSVAGVNGEVPGTPVFTYSRNGGAFGATAPLGAGTWSVKANFAGGGNYTAAAEQTATITITPKPVTSSITASGKTYDGTTSVLGAVGCSLTGVLGLDSGTTGCAASGASFDDPNVGSRTVTATVALTGSTADNYALSPTSASVVAAITQAPSTTLVSVSNATYDAQPHGATALATGVGGLSSAQSVTYVGISGTSYPSSTTAPTNAGSYSASATFAGDLNHTGSTDSKSFTIGKRAISLQALAPDLIWTGSPLTPVYSIQVAASSLPLASGDLLSGFGSPIYAPSTVTNVGSYPITVSGLASGNYQIGFAPASVVVLDKSAPTGSITSLNPVALGVAPTLVVNFNDVTTGNSNIVAWKLTLDGVDQGTFGVSGGPNASFTKTLAPYSNTDVVSVCVSGQDAGGNWSAPSCGLLAIYDPSAGFVTGGGWINSPAGAYVQDPLLTGKANFGFVSKYQKGANVPTGNTEFQFKEGNLNFSSTSFQWLVIQGTTMSQFKGVGTINGQGSYNFLVTAIDGDQFSPKKSDAFRIKITNGSSVVYDNQIGTDETSTSATSLGGGSIQIQAK